MSRPVALLMSGCCIFACALIPTSPLAAADTYAGKYSWSQSGGGKSGQKGKVTAEVTDTEAGYTIAYSSQYQGKTHDYTGTLAPDPEDERVLRGVAKQGKKVAYHVVASISDKGGFRGIAYLALDKKTGKPKDQIATFEMKRSK